MSRRTAHALAGLLAVCAACELGAGAAPGGRLPALLDGGVAGASAEGKREGEASAPVAPPLASPTAGAPVALRRLTRVQYRNSVRELLGVELPPALVLPDDERVGPFQSNVSVPLGDTELELYMRAAETVSGLALASGVPDWSCDADPLDDACIERFLATLGRRAYRHPPGPDELTALRTVFDAGRALGVHDAIAFAVQAVLQAPRFLYLIEPEAPGDSAEVALDDHALAARLSYFLWNSMPDAELFALADAGQLGDETTLRDQIRRMLDSPRFEPVFVSFHMQWLGLDAFRHVTKDPVLFPEFDAALQDAMVDEAGRFFRWVFTQRGGRAGALFEPGVGFPLQGLAAIYGVPAEDSATPVALPASERAGMLTLPIALSRYAHPDQPSAVLRGLWVRERLLCSAVPAPPPGVDTSPPEPDGSRTGRELAAQHASDPLCNSCHRLMEPIGLGFERFDAIGRHRDEEAGQTLEAAGEIVGSDVAGPFRGMPELGARLATSADVLGCIARQWFRFAHGRQERSEDEPALQRLAAGFVASDGDLPGLLAELVKSRGFRFRVRSGPTEAP